VLAPAQADQPALDRPPLPCASGKPCAAAGADAHPRIAARRAPECRRLRAAIVESEQSDRRGRAAMMESVQQDLSILRQRYRKLGCAAGAST
jgi:hypothetical protein